MNKHCLTKIIILVLFLLPQTYAAVAVDFYVSPTGNDKNEGTKENPFLTFERAKKAILRTKAADCTIWLADGIHAISEAIVFEVSEFENRDVNIKVKALDNTSPVISGGTQLKGWKEVKNGLWSTDLKINDSLRELFVGQRRAIRARFPNNEYLRIKEVGADRRTHFFFEENEFPIPKRPEGIELVLLHDWSISRIEVKEIDLERNKLTAVDSIGAKNPSFFNLDHWEKHPRYFLENSMEFLDADYEWYHDSKKKKLYLKLPEAKNPNALEIFVPVASQLVQVKGEKDNLIKNIHFEGIAFKHCAWQIPEDGYCGVQACYHDARPAGGWKEVPPAIKLEWAEKCSLINCRIENTGTSGLWISTGCKSCMVKNSVFSDISGNGIMIGEGRERYVDGEVWWKKVPEQVASENTVEDCTISKVGAQYFGAVGIWCGFVSNTTIKNNEVYDLPYSGISIGWEWSPAPTPCKQNIVDGNHIHHILNILSDGGGIYMLGLQPGSKLINNHIHDVKINAGRAESNGMFLDEGTTDVVIANNLIYNIAKSPLRFHRATTNLVKENHLFCKNENPPVRYNSTNAEDIKKVDNKVFSEGDVNYDTELKRMIEKWKEN